METPNRPDRYGTMIIALHWITAALILFLLISGFRAGATIDPAAKATILRYHIPIGLAILMLTLFRVFWWWRKAVKPGALPGTPKWQHRAAGAVHIAFYVVMIGMVLSGIGMIGLSGASPILFGGDIGTLPDFTKFLPRVPHGLGGRLLVGLFVVHVGAALYHHFGLRDASLRRMWPSR